MDTRHDGLRAADTVDDVRVYVREDADPQRVLTDVVALANAGAALTHAIYHGGAAFVVAMPEPVVRAYMRACEVYGVTTIRVYQSDDAGTFDSDRDGDQHL
jgi:hypothetical protein